MDAAIRPRGGLDLPVREQRSRVACRDRGDRERRHERNK